MIPTLSDTFNRSLDEIMEEQMDVSLRPDEFSNYVKEFRNAIVHGDKNLALRILENIKQIVSDNDPFFITARIALQRMK